MSAEYRPCSRCGLSKIHFRSTATLCDDCRASHNEGSCDLCTGYHDAEEVAFMNRRRAMTEDRVPSHPIDFEEQRRMERWMRRQRMLSPFRRVWHRLRGHSVGRYACFTCDMDLPR